MDELLIVVSAGTLILLSAICSGLNVALLSLKLSDVKRKAQLGNKHAKRALPIRKKVHFYLSGILLANVAFASGASILLGSQLNGLYAVFLSTILLVIFAEIMPQAIAVNRALTAISIFSRPIRYVSLAAYPITRPLQLLLDRIVGKSNEKLHSRRELSLLISDHHGDLDSELDNDEVEIVQNALQLSEKRVHEIMTPIDKVYHLTVGDVIDGAKIDEMTEKNWSRIPIFNQEKTHCNNFILLKDLVDIDFDEDPRNLHEVTNHKAKAVGSMTALDTMFRKFIAAKSHMMVVTKDKKIVGIVTIEDLIEEIIGHEIVDETDVAKSR
jgi:metal transporter CNNM